jgi:hypothetical protein
MTFLQLQERVSKGVQRADLEDLYPDFINEALREIQNRRSWTVMKDTTTVTIPNGSSEIELPATFKEMQKSRPPVHAVCDDDVLMPVDLVFEEQETRRSWTFGGLVYNYRVFLERSNGSNKLKILVPATEDIELRVKYYGYLPDLEADDDESPLANLYPEMVIAKAKAIAFTTINDPMEASMEETFEKKFIAATVQDAHADVAGRETRM